jgi:hypothetical protein
MFPAIHLFYAAVFMSGPPGRCSQTFGISFYLCFEFTAVRLKSPPGAKATGLESQKPHKWDSVSYPRYFSSFRASFRGLFQLWTRSLGRGGKSIFSAFFFILISCLNDHLCVFFISIYIDFFHLINILTGQLYFELKVLCVFFQQLTCCLLPLDVIAMMLF